MAHHLHAVAKLSTASIKRKRRAGLRPRSPRRPLMRTGLAISAALASAFFASTALADRTNDYDNKSTHSKEIKERVIDQERQNVPTQSDKTTKTDVSGAQKVLASKTDHQAKGELYDNYGKSGNATTNSTSTSSSSSKAGQAVALQKSGDEMVDPKSKSDSHLAAAPSDGTIFLSWHQVLTNPSHQSDAQKNYGPMGKQIAWTAGGKTVRSFVHTMNDKGQINNNPHGSTATAMHARHQMSAILSIVGRPIKLFNWEGSGGDNSEDNI